jgi:hypothetical protein
MTPPFSCDLPVFKFCGRGFLNQFITGDQENDLIMLSSFRLLSYAYSMALTGQGSKTRLLGLKGQVIRCISASMKASEGLLSPRCLTAILALGTAIICLVCQDLPKSLTMWEYINASMQDDYLCCQEAADTAKSALREQVVHHKVMDKHIYRSKASFKDADSLALLQYVSNCRNMQVPHKSLCHAAFF